MPEHLCSACLGIPLLRAAYVVADLFSSTPSTTHCPYSRNADGIILDNDIAAFISDNLLECYYPHELGDDLRVCLIRDFHLFSDVLNVDEQLEIIETLFGSDSKGHYRLKDNINFRQKIDDFHEELKASRRFFFDKDGEFAFIFHTLDSLIKTARPCSCYLELNPDTKCLYRARLGSRFDEDRNQVPYPLGEMGAAPNQFCKGGRINPPGMSFLYLASSEDTAALEIRATPADVFTVADVFLRNDPLLLDLRRSSFSTLSGFKFFPESRLITQHLEKVAVYTYLSEILAQPVASEDPLGYIHTQIFCEYFKIKGVHGLIYDSTLCSSGFNVCVFEPTEFSELVGESRLARVSALSAEVVLLTSDDMG